MSYSGGVFRTVQDLICMAGCESFGSQEVFVNSPSKNDSEGDGGTKHIDKSSKKTCSKNAFV